MADWRVSGADMAAVTSRAARRPGPPSPQPLPPRLHTLACIYKELGRMVFTKKKNLLKGWMWAVRGHELVPGIQKGTHAMELREDGEPCVPPERSRWRAVALLLPHQARMSPLGGRVEAVAVMSSRVGMPSSKSLLWMMEVLMELKILVWCSSLPRPASSATR